MIERLPALLLLAPGCVELTPTLVELDDVGEACLGEAYVGTVDIADGQSATVSVTLEGCASACATDVSASCTAELEGTTIRVEAAGAYTLPSGSPTCPPVCTVVMATCETVALAAGTYTLAYAGDSGDFDVPGAVVELCVGELYPE